MIYRSAEGLPCTANVLTDPANPKSSKARCCKLPSAWTVVNHKSKVVDIQGACPSHVNILLEEMEDAGAARV